MTIALALLLASATPACPDGTFVTLEEGVVAGADWVSHSAGSVHTRSVLTQSRIIDATIELRPDETAARATTSVSQAGEAPSAAQRRELGEGATYWSGMVPSSIEQAVRRARVLGQRKVRLPAASPSSDWRGEVEVERLGPNDWIVAGQGKRYEVLTDEQGCMLSASLPSHGVVIERRSDFPPERYPLWAPHSAPPDGAYAAQEVRIPTPPGHVLAGTLTTPKQRTRFPAAVLLTGLAPHERNNGFPPWMPFRDLADALTRAGIAVLRVDDRGVGASTGDHAPTTSFDEAEDVAAEVRWLRARPDIDPRRIALVGYSEGALVASIVAARDPGIAAVVSLDGTGVPGAQLARFQTENAVNGDPTIAPTDREKAIARELADLPTVREREVLKIDPLQWAGKVKCPALIVQGGNDRHVPPRSAEHLAWAMRASGNKDVTVRLFPGLSHSLLPDPIGLSAQWVMLPAFVTAPDLLATVTSWATAHLRR